MQVNEFVFKVPKAKKRRHSLYCTETLSELDDGWGAPEWKNNDSRFKHSVTESRNRPQASDRLFLRLETVNADHDKLDSSDTGEPQMCLDSISTTEGCDVYSIRDLLMVSDLDNDKFIGNRKKYTLGLLQEFSHKPPSSCPVVDSYIHCSELDNVCKTYVSPPKQKSLVCQKEKALEQESGKTVDQESPQSPNVLIVRDESMANADSDSTGSDIDWESVTPPTARSPSDHTVPDLDDLSTVTPPGDFLLFPGGPFMSVAQLEELAVPQAEELAVPQAEESRQSDASSTHLFSSIAFEHAFPDLYC